MDGPTPTGSWYYRFRRHADRRNFYIALAISAVLHLSMVTVFSIVVYFPRQDMVYYDFEIVPLNEPGQVAESDPPPPEPGGLGGERLALRGGDGAQSALPELELPTLEFAELERLRVRQESFESLSRYDDIFREAPEDSWARFSRGLTGMSRSLSQLSLSGPKSPDGEAPLLPELPPEPGRIVHEPADGFEAHLVWSGAPRDRKLLFAPPIEALWEVNGRDLEGPIEVVLQVNALGRVVNVFSPTVDAGDLVDTVQMTVLRYRFEPLDLDEGANQTATLRIQRKSGDGSP